MSDTPKTDRHIKEVEDSALYADMDVCTPEFARELERENSKMLNMLSWAADKIELLCDENQDTGDACNMGAWCEIKDFLAKKTETPIFYVRAQQKKGKK